jgi:hypothetical protein
MASILSFASRVFRTRDPARDTATDRDRLMTVRSSIVAAIDSASRERDGLKRRVDNYFASASHILDQADFEERSADDEAAVVEAERQGSAGLQRIAVIEAQIGRLNDMLAYFDDQDVGSVAVAVHG